MSVVVIGIEHQRAPLGLLERVALGEADLAKTLGTLRSSSNVQEAVVLSTCLRTEVYAVVDRFHDAVEEVRDLLAAHAGAGALEIEEHSIVRFDDDVAVHLFSVAAGLESAVLGESEVLGQVRRAWEAARDERASGPVLAELFRHAVQAGKRVRTDTAIARGTTSFAHGALGLAESRRPGGLGGTSTVVVGAGEMGAGVVRALYSLPSGRRPAALTVVNRTPERALDAVSGAPPGMAMRAAGWEEVAEAIAGADVAFTAVEAEPHLLSAETVAGSGRAGRPLLLVDLGMPRNVDPSASDVEGLTLCDMDDLRAAVDRAMEDRRGEVERAAEIVTEELAGYRTASRARGAAPVIGALRSRLEDLRAGELARRGSGPAGLSPAALALVDEVSRAVLAKVLHEPSVVLRETSGTPRGERLVEALRTLFDL